MITRYLVALLAGVLLIVDWFYGTATCEVRPMAKKKTLSLPTPDRFGNYWFGTKPLGPVILHSRFKGKYLASGGAAVGVLRVQGAIRYFDRPEEALAALREAGVLEVQE